MNSWFELVGPNKAVQIFGVKLVGFNAENGAKLLFSFGFVLCVFIAARFLHVVVVSVLRRRHYRTQFWARQGIHLATALALVIGLLSIWFDDPTRLATALGLITAGLAFALQKVVTALAGYFVILRGRTFNVGDRISMGGVRGDVIALGLMQTTIMEMGQPPDVYEQAEPAMWVRGRQYTGRIVTVSNDKIFDEPVFNFTRDFPYVWEEIRVPITYDSNRGAAEQIVLDAVTRRTMKVTDLSREALEELKRRYFLNEDDMIPRVFLRLTDNWLELGVRFFAADHGIRALKDAITRDILDGFDAAKITIASATYAIVSVPRIRVSIGDVSDRAA
ncbi:MAG TPA: mechanosensitive ion channel domain-containing protein [Terriglobia bacterium]|nr:mechanosensitive ion channel domain-containing protein [Terriglobia bacterium]